MTGTDTLKRQAEADLRAALDARPDDARSWYALGELLYTDGRFTESAQALETALNRDAYLVEVRAVVSLLFFASLNLQKFDDAARWCRDGDQPLRRRSPVSDLSPHSPGLDRKESPRCGQGVAGDREHREARLDRNVQQPVELFPDGGGDDGGAGRHERQRPRYRRKGSRRFGGASGTEVRTEEAYVKLLLGQREEALALLREELRSDPDSRDQIVRSPWFKDLGPELTP